MMVKLSRVAMILGVLVAGVVGGFVSGMVIQRAPEAHAVAPKVQASGYSISTGYSVAFIVGSKGNVFKASGSGLEKLGQCK